MTLHLIDFGIGFLFGGALGVIATCKWAMRELDDIRKDMRPRCHHTGMISAGFCQNCGRYVG